MLAPATKNLVMSTSMLETGLGSWCRVEGEARKLVTVSIAFTAALVIGSLGVWVSKDDGMMIMMILMV